MSFCAELTEARDRTWLGAPQYGARHRLLAFVLSGGTLVQLPGTLSLRLTIGSCSVNVTVSKMLGWGMVKRLVNSGLTSR